MVPVRSSLHAWSIALLAASAATAVVLPPSDPLREKIFRDSDIYIPNLHRALATPSLAAVLTPLQTTALTGELAALGVAVEHGFYDTRGGAWGSLTLTRPLVPGPGTGNPLQWAAQNAAWGRVYRSIDALVTDRIHWISESGFYDYASTQTLDMLQAMAVIFVLVSVWPVFRRLGLAYAAMILVNVLPPLAMGGLLSMGRVTAVLFPTFSWLAAAVPRTHRSAWIAAFAMMQGVCAILFFTWRPLY